MPSLTPITVTGATTRLPSFTGRAICWKKTLKSVSVSVGGNHFRRSVSICLTSLLLKSWIGWKDFGSRLSLPPLAVTQRSCGFERPPDPGRCPGGWLGPRAPRGDHDGGTEENGRGHASG